MNTTKTTTPSPKTQHKINPTVENVRAVLSKENLTIPAYQRPYKWSVKHVNQLIDDVLHFKDKAHYRLGTIVFHEEEGKLNIVDGQQRTITLALMLWAIQQDKRLVEIMRTHRLNLPFNPIVAKMEFTHALTKENIRTNYREIQHRLADFDIRSIQFLLDRCEFVVVKLNDISEAFQFFDSQNARGKDLDPHDLLKAFHLREIDPKTPERDVKQLVAKWEDLNSQDLAHTFSNYLFRIRYWSKGQSARFFTKREVDEFKGISPTVSEPFPYAGLYKIAHHYVDGYNAQFDRHIDGNDMKFPFQLDQVIINGKRFFEFVDHYNAHIQAFRSEAQYTKWVKSDSVAARILHTINNYDARHRTGDQYVRTLFDTAVMYYIDKFGRSELERAIEKIFIWAYTLRLQRQSVQLASMDNHALAWPYVFHTIKNALVPSQFLNSKLHVVTTDEFSQSNKTGKLKEIVELFTQLNYIQ